MQIYSSLLFAVTLFSASYSAKAALQCTSLFEEKVSLTQLSEGYLLPQGQWRAPYVKTAPVFKTTKNSEFALINGVENGTPTLRLIQKNQNQNSKLKIHGNPIIFSDFLSWGAEKVVIVNYIPENSPTPVTEVYNLKGEKIKTLDFSDSATGLSPQEHFITDLSVHPLTEDSIITLAGRFIFTVSQPKGEIKPWPQKSESTFTESLSHSPTQDYSARALKNSEHDGVNRIQFTKKGETLFEWVPQNANGIKNHDVAATKDFLASPLFSWDSQGRRLLALDKQSGEFVVFDFHKEALVAQQPSMVDLATSRPKIPSIAQAQFIDENTFIMVKQTDRAYPDKSDNEPPPNTPRKLELEFVVVSLEEGHQVTSSSSVLIDYNLQPHQGIAELYSIESSQKVVGVFGDSIVAFDRESETLRVVDQPQSRVDRSHKKRFRFLFSRLRESNEVETFDFARGRRLWNF